MGLQASATYEYTSDLAPTTGQFSTSYSKMEPANSAASATLNPSAINAATGFMECGMCFEPMGGGATKKLAVPPCGHAYCYDCLVRVVREAGGKCPGCRKPFTEASITRVFS